MRGKCHNSHANLSTIPPTLEVWYDIANHQSGRSPTRKNTRESILSEMIFDLLRLRSR